MVEEMPENKYEGLTASEIEELEKLHQMIRIMYQGNETGLKMGEFLYEQQRLWKLMAHALEELRESRPELYYSLFIAVRRDMQKFWDIVNILNDSDSEVHNAERLSANQMIANIDDLRYTGLFTNDGYEMRGQLINALADHSEARKLVGILKQLQKLMPELGPEDDFDF